MNSLQILNGASLSVVSLIVNTALAFDGLRNVRWLFEIKLFWVYPKA
jgi:hypothetical protein